MTSLEAPEPIRCELLTAKQFSQVIRKEKLHSYTLFLNETLTQSCMNNSEESLEYLKLEIIEDLTGVFPTESPKTLPPERFVDHHIDLLPETKPFSRAFYRLSKFETDEVEKVVQELLSQCYTCPSTSPWAAPVLLPPKRMES